MEFDEAFDKLDDLRIESMMEFLKNINLQIIMATPPHKTEELGKFVKTVQIVSYNNETKQSFVSLFQNMDVLCEMSNLF